MNSCFICQDKEKLSAWKHPESGEEYLFCSYCFNTVIGVCAECSSILSKLDPIGVNNDGKRICYKCSAMHDMHDDES